MQLPRKMSAQNVMASISRTLGTRNDQNVKASNEVKFAGEESKDKLYEPKHRQKAFRVMTVIAYVISVSLAAIILSLYYLFIWDPKDHARFITRQSTRHNVTTKVECINPTLPTGLETQDVIVPQQKITIKPNATEFMRRLESIYPPIYIDKDEENEATNELEASLEPMPSMSPTSTEEIEDLSEDTVDEPPDIEFDSENLPRR